MDIEQRASLKRREAEEADQHADRATVAKGQQNKRRGMIAQSGNQPLADVGTQRRATANRVAGVRVEHVDHPGAVRGVVEISRKDFDRQGFTYRTRVSSRDFELRPARRC